MHHVGHCLRLAYHVFTCVDTEVVPVRKDGPINAYGVSGGISPRVLNFGTGLR